MDKEHVRKVTKQFASSIDTDMDVRKVVLYGSWVDGQPHEDSDIDVAVVVRECKSDFLDLLTKLYQIASLVDVRIEPNLFEEDRDADHGFLSHILARGEIVYEQDGV
jgi:uncharacterized protein